MKHATLATSADIALWASRMEAAAQLPRLVRLLLHATGRDLSRIGFPADQGIRSPGYDGVLVAGGGDPCIPTGTSVWELSTEADVVTKANEDYRKRLADPRGYVPIETTYVAVTARQWPGDKQAWVQARRAEGVWRDVNAYDAHDLEQWLERAPGVHLWLSQLMRMHPEGASAIEPYWEDWSGETDPPTAPSLVLAGRAQTATDVHDWLRGGPPTLLLCAESREEAIAVFLAAIMQLGPEERAAYVARSTVLTTEPGWRAVADFHSGLILIPAPHLDVEGAAVAAQRRGHRVLIPLGRADLHRRVAYEVPKVSVEDAAAALKAAGVDEHLAWELAALARRSIHAYRRRVGRLPELCQPEWARPENAPNLIPMLLLGSWTSTKEGDRKALENLAGRQYRDLEPVLSRWANKDDPPFRRVGDRWYLLSREDAWVVLSRFIQRTDMERFKEQALLALGTPNPKFDLPDNDQWWAAVSGHVPNTSSELCEAMAETLAILGARGQTTDIGNATTAADYASLIVRELLAKANTDWRIWASLSDWRVLPLLAEAAPDVFLDAVEVGLAGDAPLRSLFRDGPGTDPVFSSSPHAGLLWALEVLAWSPDYLSRTVLLLAKLAQLDPGGNLQNRPLNVLREILLSWNPQSAAPLSVRIAALDVIRARAPEVAWDLLVKLLPEFQSSANLTARPKWREWALGVPTYPPDVDRLGMVSAVLDRTLADADALGARWAQIIDSLGAYTLDHHRIIVAKIRSLDAVHMPEPDKSAIWHALRTLIAHHRGAPGAKWSLHEELLSELEALMAPFEPQDPTDRLGWLFKHWVQLLHGGDDRDHAARERAVEAERDQAVAALYAQGGIDLLGRMAQRVETPAILGHTLGRSALADAEADKILGEGLAAADSPSTDFASGFVAGRIQRSGERWADPWLADERLSGVQRAELLLALQPTPRVFDLASGLGSDGETHYWSRINVWRVPNEYSEDAARRLIQLGQPQKAVDLLGKAECTSAPLIMDALEATLKDPTPGRPSPMFAHSVEGLFDALAKAGSIDAARVAQLEWGFLPILERHQRRPLFLHQELASNPDFFVDVLCAVYRGHNDPPRDVPPEEQHRAHQAYALLDSWRVPPGLTGDTLDPELLLGWIRTARARCRERDREAIGDETIGQVLSGAPPDSDGSWPSAALERVIEEVSSRALERGVELGVFNGRGVVSRSVWGGGDEERAIAERFERHAEAVAGRAPRTAAMLRRLAATYRGMANQLDQTATVREDFGR